MKSYNQNCDIKENGWYSLPNRKFLLQANLHRLSEYENPNGSRVIDKVKKSFCPINVNNLILNTIPVLKWIPKYSVKDKLMGDCIAGVTVGIMQLPQSMAYGILAGVSPICGLYSSFVAALVYFLFGTSKQVSIGTSAMLSMMALRAVQTFANTDNNSVMNSLSNSTSTENIIGEEIETYSPIQVIIATTFMCGIFQLIMCILKLSKLSSLLSEPLVSAYTTAIAFHLVVSQLKDLFGIVLPVHKGYFKLFFTVKNVISVLPNSNMTTVYLSTFTIVFLIIMNERIKPKLSKYCSFPLPSELIVLITMTLASYFFQFNTNYNIKIVEHIPLGVPMPALPSMKLLWLVAADSLPIAIVSYTITISLSKLFAKNDPTDQMRPNQEMFALGLCNISSSLFSGIPIGSSLCRSVIQKETGGNSQLASVFSASLILCVLLFVGPYFENLPICILSSILVVALKTMFIKIYDIKRFLKEGKLESATWLVTFFSVIFISADIGLVCGLVIALLALYLRGWKPKSHVLGIVPETDIYVDINSHKNAKELPSIKIFRYIGAINFATSSSFKKSLFEKTQLSNLSRVHVTVDGECFEKNKLLPERNVLILDMSSVTHLDVAGYKIIIEIQDEIDHLSTKLILVCPNDRVYDTIKHSEFLGIGGVFVMPSIADAVSFAQNIYLNIVK